MLFRKWFKRELSAFHKEVSAYAQEKYDQFLKVNIVHFPDPADRYREWSSLSKDRTYARSLVDDFTYGSNAITALAAMKYLGVIFGGAGAVIAVGAAVLTGAFVAPLAAGAALLLGASFVVHKIENAYFRHAREKLKTADETLNFVRVESAWKKGRILSHNLSGLASSPNFGSIHNAFYPEVVEAFQEAAARKSAIAAVTGNNQPSPPRF